MLSRGKLNSSRILFQVVSITTIFWIDILARIEEGLRGGTWGQKADERSPGGPGAGGDQPQQGLRGLSGALETSPV